MNQILETRNIFDLLEIKYSKKEKFDTFYTNFRACISSNLKKKGDQIAYLDKQLTEDEIISPTFEDVIILWCLDKIDPSLPVQVKKTFTDQIENNITLKDIQVEIFKILPLLIDSVVAAKADKVNDETFYIDDIQVKEEDEPFEFYNSDVSSEDQNDADIDGEVDLEKVAKQERKKKKNSNSTTNSCSECDKSYDTKKKLYHHKRIHKLEHCICEICNKTFDRKKYLMDHKYRYHRLSIKCQTCDVLLTSKVKYEKHMKEEHNENLEPVDDVLIKTEIKLENSLSCEFCKKQFSSKDNLYAHKHRMHIVSLACGKCDQEFPNRKCFDAHMRTHDLSESKSEKLEDNSNENKSEDIDNDAKAMISKDNFTFILPSELESLEPKVILHQREKKHSCDVCGKLFFGLSYLKVHRSKHFLNQDLTCVTCKEKFESKKLLKIHMKNNHQAKKVESQFSCEICGKMFKSNWNLNNHLKKHSDDWNKLKCNTCSRSFTKEEQMGSHICKHFSCDLCDKKFVRIRNLQYHKREHAGEIMFPCDMCEGLFDKKKRLCEHKRFVHRGVKRYKCELCPKEFAMKIGLNRHKLVHTGERPFKCDECSQSFRQQCSLNIHKRMHNNELPFECDVCLQRFRTMSLLKSHRESKLCGFTEQDMFKNSTES